MEHLNILRLIVISIDIFIREIFIIIFSNIIQIRLGNHIFTL